MKFYLIPLIGIFGFGFFQYGCGNANKANQSSVNNQNLVVALASPTPSPLPETPENENASNNGISFEEAKPLIELQERCKHAPVSKVKATPITGTAPLKVTFDGSASYDPDKTKIAKWEWHFGNGQSSEGRTVTYIYEKPGKYGIGLNVTDSQGQKTSDCGTGATDIEIVVTDGKNTNKNITQKGN